jgi:hypothetical protein
MSSRGSIGFLAILFFALGAFCLNVPAAIVTNTNDDGPGSLREAIALAGSGDTIEFKLSGCPCAISLISGQIAIDKNLTILGLGTDQLTISGGNLSRVFFIAPSSLPDSLTVTIESLRISGGRAKPLLGDQGSSSGGGIYAANTSLTLRNVGLVGNAAHLFGGGVYSVAGQLSVIESRVADNQALDASGSGGGIAARNFSELEVRNSTISNNFAPASGGGILVGGISSAKIVASTISGNRTDGIGGGIYNIDSTTSITNSTISGNFSTGQSTVGGGGGGIANDSQSGNSPATLNVNSSTITKNRHNRTGDTSGAGILNIGRDGSSTVNIGNTIVADNEPDKADAGNLGKFGGFSSSGFNLIGIVGSSTAFTQIGDQTGTAASPLDPRLEALAANGGPTQTHVPRLDSPAVDRGNSFGLGVDQRGQARPNDNPDIPNGKGDGSDIGSVEISFPVFGGTLITGRVLDENGRPLRRGYVIMTDSAGRVTYTTINPFGFYRFIEAPLGRTITLRIQSKQYTADPRTVFVVVPRTDFDLAARRIPDPDPTKD